MSVIDWVRLIWETPEEFAARRQKKFRRDFQLQMMEDPDKTVAESLREGVEELRQRGKLPAEYDNISKAA